MIKARALVFLLLWSLPALAETGGRLFVESDMCVRCHLLGENRGAPNPVLGWARSAHFQPGSGCADCHGGNPAVSLPSARGHLGLPTKPEIIALCGKCHADQASAFLARPAGDPGEFNCVVTCVDCHGYHDTPPARADFITAGNCSGCHGMERLAARARAVAQARAALAGVDAELDRFDRELVPTEGLRREAMAARKRFADSFHSRPPEMMAEGAREALKAAGELSDRMQADSPGRWRIQGLAVVGFLTAALLILSGYNSSRESKEDTMSNHGAKGPWAARLALAAAAAALALTLQQRFSPTDRALTSVNHTVTETVVPQLKKANDRAMVDSVYEMKRMIVTLDQIKENSESYEVRSRIDQLKLDLEELSVKVMVNE